MIVFKAAAWAERLIVYSQWPLDCDTQAARYNPDATSDDSPGTLSTSRPAIFERITERPASSYEMQDAVPAFVWRGVVKARTIIQGHDGPIEIDEATETVVKSFSRLDRRLAVDKVEREVAQATRFGEALARKEGLACPQILAWELDPVPRIVMRLCRGEPLSRFLSGLRERDTRIEKIAGRVSEGLRIYIDLFGEPYYDFSFQNMLYNEATSTLTFLDFSAPDRLEQAHDGTPLEMSLGHFVGWSCYEMARPARLVSPRHGYLDVIRAVLGHFDNDISRAKVGALARTVFSRLTRPGRVLRRAYYQTAGHMMAARYLRLLQLDSVPAVPPVSRLPR